MMALILGTFSTVLVALALIWLWRLKPGPRDVRNAPMDPQELMRRRQLAARHKAKADWF